MNNINLANEIFSFLFIFECMLRIIGCRFDFYMKDVWNKLDFIVSITSLIDILLN